MAERGTALANDKVASAINPYPLCISNCCPCRPRSTLLRWPKSGRRSTGRRPGCRRRCAALWALCALGTLRSAGARCALLSRGCQGLALWRSLAQKELEEDRATEKAACWWL